MERPAPACGTLGGAGRPRTWLTGLLVARRQLALPCSTYVYVLGRRALRVVVLMCLSVDA